MKRSLAGVFVGLLTFAASPCPSSEGYESTQQDGVVQDVTFVAECDGTKQKYVIMLPDRFQPEKTYGLLIVFHGHGADRWQFIRDPRPECRAARDVAGRRQLIYVSPDYRARTSWMGPKAESDVLQIVRQLKTKYRISKIFVCGGSMGGTACLTFAVRHPELVDGVASMNGTANLLEYDNFQDAIRTSFGGTKAEIPLEYKNRSAEYWPERLTMPVAFSVGGRDRSVPPDSVRRLAKVLKTIGRDVLLIDRDTQGHATNYADAVALLEYVIGRAEKRPEDAGDD